MKALKTIGCIIGAICLLTFNTGAQTLDSDIDVAQALFGMEKQQLMIDVLEISKNDPFWDSYKEYDQARKEIAKKRIKMLIEYSENYEEISEDRVKEIISETQSLNGQYDKLLNKYYKLFAKKYGVKKAAQFYQIELYINTAIRLQLMDIIPFVE